MSGIYTKVSILQLFVAIIIFVPLVSANAEEQIGLTADENYAILQPHIINPDELQFA